MPQALLLIIRQMEVFGLGTQGLTAGYILMQTKRLKNIFSISLLPVPPMPTLTTPPIFLRTNWNFTEIILKPSITGQMEVGY